MLKPKNNKVLIHTRVNNFIVYACALQNPYEKAKRMIYLGIWKLDSYLGGQRKISDFVDAQKTLNFVKNNASFIESIS